MPTFFRFPHTPHIAWLGDGEPRGDKLMSAQEADALLAAEVIVEEKLDGANVGFSIGSDGAVRVQNRGQYLLVPFTGQFARLGAWLERHRLAFTNQLDGRQLLFGEWCAARHSIAYDALPDWFLLFDVYDCEHHRFWSCARRNRLAESLGLVIAPVVFRGRVTLPGLRSMLETRTSSYAQERMEGLVVRRESAEWCLARGKLVRAEFAQPMDVHWRNRTIEWNHLQRDGALMA